MSEMNDVSTMGIKLETKESILKRVFGQTKHLVYFFCKVEKCGGFQFYAPSVCVSGWVSCFQFWWGKMTQDKISKFYRGKKKDWKHFPTVRLYTKMLQMHYQVFDFIKILGEQVGKWTFKSFGKIEFCHSKKKIFSLNFEDYFCISRGFSEAFYWSLLKICANIIFVLILTSPLFI